MAEAQSRTVPLYRELVGRIEPLAKQRAIPQEDYENALAAANVAEAQVQQAKSSVKAAQAAVAQAKLNLGYTVIRLQPDKMASPRN